MRREIKLVAGGRLQGSRGAGRSSRPQLSCCQRLPGRGGGDISETRSQRGRLRTGFGPGPQRPQPGGGDPQTPATAATPNRLPSRPRMVSGTPSPLPASSAPSGRLYLLSGCSRRRGALPLTGRIPSRRRCRCRCRRRRCHCRRRELSTPAPSGNPGNREHHPLPSPVRTQTRSPARARLPLLARPEPRPSLVGHRRRRRRDAWSHRANREGRRAGRASGREGRGGGAWGFSQCWGGLPPFSPCWCVARLALSDPGESNDRLKSV